VLPGECLVGLLVGGWAVPVVGAALGLPVGWADVPLAPVGVGLPFGSGVREAVPAEVADELLLELMADAAGGLTSQALVPIT
jgi:hypothetical protein